MAVNIELDEGSSGKYTETEEVSTNIHRQVMKIAGVSACKLARTRATSQSVTCSAASTDYTSSTSLQSWTKYVRVYCANDCIVAMGENTSSSVGIYVAGGLAEVFPVTYTDGGAYDRVHAQSPVAGSVVRLTFLAD